MLHRPASCWKFLENTILAKDFSDCNVQKYCKHLVKTWNVSFGTGWNSKLWFLTGYQVKPELCYLIFICRTRSWNNDNGAQTWAHITVSNKAQRAETPIDFSFSDLRWGLGMCISCRFPNDTKWYLVVWRSVWKWQAWIACFYISVSTKTELRVLQSSLEFHRINGWEA